MKTTTTTTTTVKREHAIEVSREGLIDAVRAWFGDDIPACARVYLPGPLGRQDVDSDAPLLITWSTTEDSTATDGEL